jgi:hypothetical protein
MLFPVHLSAGFSMGYSLSVRFSSKAERDHMLAFLEKQDWRALHKCEPQATGSHPTTGDNLGYPPKGDLDRVLGFNGSMVGRHVWDVGAWWAVKSKHRNGGNPSVYWDDERMDIVAGRDPKPGEEQRTRTDARGLPNPNEKPSSIFEFLSGLLPSGRKAQLQWMEQLEANWNNEPAFKPANTAPVAGSSTNKPSKRKRPRR